MSLAIRNMIRLFNIMRNNFVLSWSFAVAIGFLFYIGYHLVRSLLMPLITLVPAEIFYAPITGEIAWKVAIFNILESGIVAIPIAIIISLLLCLTFEKRAGIYGLASIMSFAFLFTAHFILQLPFDEPKWVAWIRLIKPIIAGIILWVVLRLMIKSKITFRKAEK